MLRVSRILKAQALKDWFEGSRIVAAGGKPLTVFHGTNEGSITAFKPNRYGLIWVTPAPNYASAFSGDTGSVYPLYARALNPLDLRFFGEGYVAAATFAQKLQQDGLNLPVKAMDPHHHPAYWWIREPEVLKAIKAAGYDAIWVKEGGTHGATDTLALFSPGQLRSALESDLKTASSWIQFWITPQGKRILVGDHDEYAAGVSDIVGDPSQAAFNLCLKGWGKGRLSDGYAALASSRVTQVHLEAMQDFLGSHPCKVVLCEEYGATYEGVGPEKHAEVRPSDFLALNKVTDLWRA